MTKLYVNTEELKNRVIPYLDNSISELDNAINIANGLKNNNPIYTNNYLKSVSYNLTIEKEKLVKMVRWINDSINDYKLFNENNIPYISKCIVEGVSAKNKED